MQTRSGKIKLIPSINGTRSFENKENAVKFVDELTTFSVNKVQLLVRWRTHINYGDGLDCSYVVIWRPLNA